jgi:hypothetical protein
MIGSMVAKAVNGASSFAFFYSLIETEKRSNLSSMGIFASRQNRSCKIGKNLKQTLRGQTRFREDRFLQLCGYHEMEPVVFISLTMLYVELTSILDP